MRKTMIITVLAVLGMTQAAAQEYEYVPFVREGVEWVYYYLNNVCRDDFTPGGKYFYSFEMKGDTIINGKSYKPVHVHGIDLNQEMVPVYLREDDKVVYGIIPEDRYLECPIGILEGVSYPGTTYYVYPSNVEFKLYDFNSPSDFYSDIVNFPGTPLLDHIDTIQVAGQLRKSYCYTYYNAWNDYTFGSQDIIEGIGYVSHLNGTTFGTPLNYFIATMMCPYPESGQVMYKLSHVIEDGEIVYKTDCYVEGEPVPGYYEYVPFVREGVKWVYYYDNPFDRDVLGMDEGIQYYSFELKGDVLIGDKHYKPVVLTHHLENGEKVVEDFTPAYLREEDKVVYAICPDGILHPQCPAGTATHVEIPDGGSPILTSDEEFVLYDFNAPCSFFDVLAPQDPDFNPYASALRIIGGRKVRFYNCLTNHVFMESIGCDNYEGLATGTPLFWCSDLRKGNSKVNYYLSHVIEDGEIIYKAYHYNPDTHVGVDEVVADRNDRPLDPNYYNLMGQPVGKEVPTAPGIYIHQGKKIVVR